MHVYGGQRCPIEARGKKGGEILTLRIIGLVSKGVMRFSLRIEKRGSFAARQFDELALLLEYTSFLILTKVYAASCLEDAGQSNRTQQTTPVFYSHFTFLFPIDAILFL